jgi:hypothetical protein
MSEIGLDTPLSQNTIIGKTMNNLCINYLILNGITDA